MAIRETDLQDLLAKEALGRLVASYSRAVDRRDFAMVQSLYAPEAFDDHGGMYQGGVEGYIAFLRQALARYQVTVHYVVQALFQVQGDQAEGEVHKVNYHREVGEPGREILTGSRSLDRYVRRQGEWLFMSRSITLDWARQGRVDPAAYQDFAAQSPHGQAGAADLSYRLLQHFPRMEPEPSAS